MDQEESLLMVQVQILVFTVLLMVEMLTTQDISVVMLQLPELSAILRMNVSKKMCSYSVMAEEKQLVLPEGEQIGLIARELEDILPQLVTHEVHAYDKNEGIEGAEKDVEMIEYKGINYIGLIPVLIEAMKEQQEQIEELKQQIAELK